MKKLILLLLLSSATYGQISLQVVQDAKLAIKGDDIGNDPFTTNIMVNVELKGQHGIVVIPTFEYANLKGGDYYRYGVNAGINYKWITPYIGVGAISRKHTTESGENTFWPSFAIGLDISAPISERISITALNQLTDRKDLKMMWNHKQYFDYSFYAGVKYRL